MKAVAYYRTRPSEPAASELALNKQREAVQKAVERDGLTLVAEFIEREGEGDDEVCPAYVAAVRAALAHKEDKNMLDVALLVASYAGIGSGEPFQPPNVEGRNGLLGMSLNATLVPAQPEIALPLGAPALLCLYADFRPRQLDTLVYLCNAGLDALSEVTAVIETTSMNSFYESEPGERWASVHYTRQDRWDSVPPVACVLINTLCHYMWDEVNRYCLTFVDAVGQRRTAEVHDLALNACWLAEEPDKVWVPFDTAAAPNPV